MEPNDLDWLTNPDPVKAQAFVDRACGSAVTDLERGEVYVLTPGAVAYGEGIDSGPTEEDFARVEQMLGAAPDARGFSFGETPTSHVPTYADLARDVRAIRDAPERSPQREQLLHDFCEGDIGLVERLIERFPEDELQRMEQDQGTLW